MSDGELRDLVMSGAPRLDATCCPISCGSSSCAARQEERFVLQEQIAAEYDRRTGPGSTAALYGAERAQILARCGVRDRSWYTAHGAAPQ